MEGKLSSAQYLELLFPYICWHSLWVFFSGGGGWGVLLSFNHLCFTLSFSAIKIVVARQELCLSHLSLICKRTDCHQPTLKISDPNLNKISFW